MEFLGRNEKKEVRLLFEIRDILLDLLAVLTPAQATTAVLTTKAGTTMATQAISTFTDATGAPIAPPTGDGTGLVVTFASDNPAVTLGPTVYVGDTATAPIIGTAEFNLSALVANTSGAPLLDNDGTTPFVQPVPISVAATTPVDQAVTAVLTTQ
jgi:hypothetical protein